VAVKAMAAREAEKVAVEMAVEKVVGQSLMLASHFFARLLFK
jgi:hypothetical protein